MESISEKQCVATEIATTIFFQRDDIFATLDALNREFYRHFDMAFLGYDDEVEPPPAIEH